jgi:hypothetical protein
MGPQWMNSSICVRYILRLAIGQTEARPVLLPPHAAGRLKPSVSGYALKFSHAGAPQGWVSVDNETSPRGGGTRLA